MMAASSSPGRLCAAATWSERSLKHSFGADARMQAAGSRTRLRILRTLLELGCPVGRDVVGKAFWTDAERELLAIYQRARFALRRRSTTIKEIATRRARTTPNTSHVYHRIFPGAGAGPRDITVAAAWVCLIAAISVGSDRRAPAMSLMLKELLDAAAGDDADGE